MTTMRTGFLQIPNVFFETCALPESAQTLFLRLAAYLGKHHLSAFTGSERQLATLMRMSRATVNRMLYALIDPELITVTISEGVESAREVMSIEVNMDKLWELNAYYLSGGTVPNWATTFPDWPNLGHNGPERADAAQFGDVTAQNDTLVAHPHAQIGDNTSNTIKTLRQRNTEDVSLSSSKKSLKEDDFSLVPPGFLKPEMRAAQ